MKKSEAKPVFHFTIDRFAGEMRTKLGYMKRDKEQFAGFGTTEEDFSPAEASIVAFENMPSDKELEGSQVLATQEKDQAADVLREAMNAVMIRAESKWGKGSGRYKMYGISGLSKLDGWSLSTVAYRIHRVAGQQQTELGSEGLTAEMLESLLSAKDAYVVKLEAQEDAMANRDIATEDRIEIANTIYRQVAKWCNLGMRIWEGSNEAKYNEYVLYGTTSAGVAEEVPARE
jgi:hypothetical protein